MTDTDRDPYRILEVAPISPQEHINRVFQARLREMESQDAPQHRRSQIQGAFDFLSDPGRRREYGNRSCFQVKRPGDFSQGGGSDAGPTGGGLLSSLMGAFQKKPKRVADDKGIEKNMSLGYLYSQSQITEFLQYALLEFQEVCSLDPFNLEALYNTALMHYKLGEFDEAIRSLRKMLSMNSDLADAGFFLALLEESVKEGERNHE
ncbi:MAG: tetratricopeptide repeat protein [Armatimonadetes bacterium]|nr:tetratricopeptide repeat protein [Armatimonadota bacterium]